MSENPTFESPTFATSEDELDEDEFDDELDDDELDDDEPVGVAGEEAAGEEEAGEEEADDDRGNRVVGGAARAVLEHVARSIVDDPGAVVVETSEARSGLLLSLHVAPGDMGRIIGKRGRVAQALRALVRSAAAREGTEATVDIVD
ncbi:MAG TPA: KH domain-containing protein [Acidimicrobiales bacterium]|nr:KH domain-containing protein [Acidimicrobiales bacterium]